MTSGKRKQPIQRPQEQASKSNNSSTSTPTKENLRSTSRTSDSPFPKRQRTLRKSTTPVMYNTKWHPMDDVINPKRAAKIKNKSPKQVDPVDSDFDSSEPEPEAHYSHADDSEGDEDDEPIIHVKARSTKARSPTRSPSPDRRRSRRIGQGEAPNYSMR